MAAEASDVVQLGHGGAAIALANDLPSTLETAEKVVALPTAQMFRELVTKFWLSGMKMPATQQCLPW
jgi:hypothetical protein